MPLYRFVDAPTASPTVLLDLDDQSPLTVVEGASTSPPNRRVSSFGSSARNGDVLAQKSYPDRQITIPLEFAPKSTAEQHSETIQKLGRLLDGEAWLQWQHDGKIEPVFYRTKYGDMDISDSIADETPLRYVTLTITAEFAAYGLPVTGTAPIANDPTAATNPMSFVFPDVQGDVATSLLLKWPFSYTSGGTTKWATAVAASSSGSVVPVSPPYVIANTTTAPSDEAGWTLTDAADTAFINGTRRRLVKSSGTLAQPVVTSVKVPFVPGDYRILVRGKAIAGTTFRFYETEDTILASYTTPTPAYTGLTWYDLGVARLPTRHPLMDSGDLVPDLMSSFNLDVQLTAATGTVDVDTLLFIPAGLDQAKHATYSSAQVGAIPGSAPSEAVVDGINSLGYSTWNDGTYDRIALTFTIAGGFAQVVPGTTNVLYFLRTAFANVDGTSDIKTATTDVEFTYFPRYLYDRPATS